MISIVTFMQLCVTASEAMQYRQALCSIVNFTLKYVKLCKRRGIVAMRRSTTTTAADNVDWEWIVLRRQAAANYSGIGPLVSGERDSALSASRAEPGRAGPGCSAVVGRRRPQSRLPSPLRGSTAAGEAVQEAGVKGHPAQRSDLALMSGAGRLAGTG